MLARSILLVGSGFIVSGNSQPCDFTRIDGRNLSWQDFISGGWRGQPVIVSGLTESSSYMNPYAGWAAFHSRFKSHRMQVGNGRNRESERWHTIMSMDKYLSTASDSPSSKPGAIFLTDLMTSLHREMFQAIALPTLLVDFIARPILSIGVNGSFEDFHRHDETWLLLLQGMKAWWIADGGSLGDFKELEPCRLLGSNSPPGIKFCIQKVGEAVFFGDHAHATCNLDEFQLAVGAQGHTEGWPPIVREARRGNATAQDFVLQLASSSARLAAVREKSPDGRTALHYNSFWGHISMAQFLIQQRADPRVVDREGMQPVDFACIAGHLPLVMHLQSEASGHRSRASFSRILHFAAMHNHIEIAKYALREGVELNSSLSSEGTEPLHVASKSGHVNMAKFLIKSHASVEAPSGQDRLTSLHIASSMGHVPTMKLLLRMRANPVHVNAKGLAPAHSAIRFGHVPVLRHILELSHNIPLRPSLVHFAAEGGQIPIIEFLLACRASVNSRDERGFQPLHVAALGGHVAGVKQLVVAGAAINAPDLHGFTAAHFAAKASSVLVLQLLTERRADLRARSKDGFTPAGVGKHLGHRTILKYLSGATHSAEREEL